jgi:hypothetical protein
MNAEDVLQSSIAVANVSKYVNGGYYRNGVAKTASTRAAARR